MPRVGKKIEKFAARLCDRFGYRLVPRHYFDLAYQHQYAGGYEEYRAGQVFHNERKLDQVWADEATLGAMADRLRALHGDRKLRGLCHGARNGFEVAWLREELGAEVLGTDISETATRFPHMVVHDFHEPHPDWRHHFDFVYSNSLDQAMDPRKALATWSEQLTQEGRIFVEHTMAHSAKGAGEMDPFGAHPMVMPYLFFQWGRGLYRLEDILEIPSKANRDMEAWLFVLRRDSDGD